ncbi:MAG: TrkH family potassium uptake protein [Candidatus Omnitrophica bacterium]|nr:TrkH family potassium uptake protein [Candidatus Omnitrophota bacterium]
MIEYRSARLLILSFAFIIILGTFLLCLPGATHSRHLSFVDAFFTATSATCVTGLIVVDTGTYFTAFGQWVILLMIQLGGLGIMTFSTFFVVALGRKLSFGSRFIFKETMGEYGFLNIFRVLKHIFIFTIAIEAIGAVVLYTRMNDFYPPFKAAYYSVFHSVTAFCNAGFTLYPDNLVRFRGDVLVNYTMMSLIVIGGLGFLALEDLYQHARRFRNRKKLPFQLHTKIVMSTTVFLVIGGALFFYLFEAKNVLVGLPVEDSVIASFFQSITARTAGFNTVDVSMFSNATLFLLVILMFIGASPASTGGGIKTTTFAVLISLFVSRMRGKERVSIFRRQLPLDVLAKAISIFFASFILIIGVTMLLQLTEHWGLPYDIGRGDFIELLFETVSAFGTVGLSTGITPNLTKLGKLLIVLTMFCGRLGPLTLAMVITGGRRQEEKFELAEESVMIG